jgi:3-deoxy-D-manno-octulosonic acid kinase
LTQSAAQPLTLWRTATRGRAGVGAMLINGSCGAEPALRWFEPDYWRANGNLALAISGRGGTGFFEHSGQQFVLRQYRRGGAAALVSADRYVFLGEAQTRPVRELKLLLRLHTAGLPVPVPVAACYLQQRRSYRGAIITGRLADTETLAQRLQHDDVGLATWAAIGRCIRRFHNFGLCHADLNAHNILLRGEDEVFLIDFDRCQLRGPGLWADANLARLRRSLDALEDRRPQRRFDDTQWHCLLAAYL